MAQGTVSVYASRWMTHSEGVAMKVSNSVLLRLCCTLALAQNSVAQPANPQLFRSFRNTDIRVIIEDVQAFTGRTIIFDPRVRGPLTWEIGKQITPEEYYTAFLQLLESIGYMAVEGDGVVYILVDDNAA